MLDPQFQNHFQSFGFILSSISGESYAGMFLISIFISYIIPLPEAVFLLLVGFVAKKTGTDPALSIAICSIGAVIGDNVLYRLSFFGNAHMQRFKRKMHSSKLIRYEHLVVENIAQSIFFLRFVAGVRFFGPVISGTLGVSWKKFFACNALATILHTSLFILLAYHSHQKIFKLIAEVEIVHNILLFSSVLIVGFLVKIFSKK